MEENTSYLNDNIASNYRTPVIAEPNLMPLSGVGSGNDPVLRTPFMGNIRALPPPLPMQLQTCNSIYGNYGTNYNYGGYGSSYGGYGFGNGYGGLGGYGSGMHNRFSMNGNFMNPMDPEARFIQLAEANSRSAFESIESLVSAIGNIASMLDSTFFALTSSFRAILGVAANFGRLRSVFAQFWQTFAIFRGFIWIYKKILYWLRITNIDTSSNAFKKAFAEAVKENLNQQGAPFLPHKGASPWPVLAFLSFIFTVPYLVLKLLGTVSNTAQEEARDPSKWVQPIETVALYDFQARNTSELTITSGKPVFIAPKEIQNTLNLLNTGWALASIDGQFSGIIPINYVKSPHEMRLYRNQKKVEKEEIFPGNSATSFSKSDFAPTVVPTQQV